MVYGQRFLVIVIGLTTSKQIKSRPTFSCNLLPNVTKSIGQKGLVDFPNILRPISMSNLKQFREKKMPITVSFHSKSIPNILSHVRLFDISHQLLHTTFQFLLNSKFFNFNFSYLQISLQN